MRTAITIFILLSSFILNAQDIQVKATLDSSQIYIGDQAIYTISVTHPAGAEMNLPVLKDTLYSNIEILSERLTDSTILNDGSLFLKKEYMVTSFDTGLYQIPPYFVELETESGIKRYYSDYVPLKVDRVSITPADSTEVIFDIIEPSKVGIGLNEILPWILLALAAGALIWLGIKYWPRRKETEEESVSIPSEPIHIIAFREFDKLEKKELWQKGKVKEYYTCLTDILRNYLYLRYAVPAQEMTSDEIIYGLNSLTETDSDTTRILSSVLLNADLSKFAKYRHDEHTNTEALTRAREYVKITYRREVSAANNEKSESTDKSVKNIANSEIAKKTIEKSGSKDSAENTTGESTQTSGKEVSNE